MRKILYPALTAHDAEAIVVCLMAHLLIEKKVNELLYQWLNQDAPDWKESNKISKARDGLWKAIIDMSFYAKYSLIRSFFSLHFPKQSEDVLKINDLRNAIFHGKAIADAKFRGKPISDEKTLESLFVATQDISMRLDKFKELIDVRHAIADRLHTKLDQHSK